MSVYDGVPAVLLSAGPSADYTAAASAVTTAQSLMVGQTYQPIIPAGYLQPGKIGSAVVGYAAGKVTGQATATTMIVTLTLGTTQGSAGGTTLAASGAVTVTSLSAAGWELDFKILQRATSGGSANCTLQCSGVFSAGTGQATSPPVSVTLDPTLNQYLFMQVTFSTASATNSATLQQFVAYGMA